MVETPKSPNSFGRFKIVNTNLMTYKADSVADWPMQVHNGKQVYGEAQLFVLRDGVVDRWQV
jgi:hypothetical protein